MIFPRSMSAECGGCGKSSHPNSCNFSFSFFSFFFSFACFAIFERARYLARIQCCYRLINHVIYQRWPTRILPIEYAAFSGFNAFVCDTFLTNLSPLFLISCTKLGFFLYYLSNCHSLFTPLAVNYLWLIYYINQDYLW